MRGLSNYTDLGNSHQAVNSMRDRERLPLVSAIIPTRNRPEMLLRAAKSVARQTYQNIELIIVDDETEGSIEERLRQEIELQACQVIKNRRKPGGSGARNTGSLRVRGSL